MFELARKAMNKVLGSDCLPGYIVSHEPLIIITYWYDFMANAEGFYSVLPKDKPVYFLFQLGWHRETRERVEDLKSEYNTVAMENVEFIFLVNSTVERKLFAEADIPHEYCHQNAFLDAKNYHILNRPKDYDAIYIARITPFKRHELAALIPRLKLVGDYFDREKEHYEKIMSILPQADWTRKIPAEKVSEYVATAYAGLCLSAEEGAMFVSTEYLLCGCPVVSTKNLGGRHELFDPDHTAIVDDSPEAVRDAVMLLKSDPPPPEEVRLVATELMVPHRQRFIMLVQSIYDKERADRYFQGEWGQVFVHKFGLRCSNWNIPSDRKIKRNHLIH